MWKSHGLSPLKGYVKENATESRIDTTICFQKRRGDSERLNWKNFLYETQ